MVAKVDLVLTSEEADKMDQSKEFVDGIPSLVIFRRLVKEVPVLEAEEDVADVVGIFHKAKAYCTCGSFQELLSRQ